MDARFRSRSGVNWVGYAVNVSETCDDEQCHLITHVETTDASVHEAQRTQVIHQALADKDLLPSEHFVDSAYVSAEHLVNAQAQQIEMVGPTRKNASWQSKIEDGYDETRVVTPKFRTVPRESTLKSRGGKHHGKQAKKLQQRI